MSKIIINYPVDEEMTEEQMEKIRKQFGQDDLVIFLPESLRIQELVS